MGAAVATSQRLQRRRINLDATLHVLRAMEGVAQAQSALHGLLPAGGGQGGVGVDYAGAIDVLEVLQGVLDDEALLALDCFKCAALGVDGSETGRCYVRSSAGQPAAGCAMCWLRGFATACRSLPPTHPTSHPPTHCPTTSLPGTCPTRFLRRLRQWTISCPATF